MNTTPSDREVLRVENLVVRFPVRRSGLFARKGPRLEVHAVEKVSLAMNAGEVLGIVGESGCGKSTLARAVARLEKPRAGSIRIHGKDINALDSRSLRRMRPDFQMIFQDPYASLNPRMTVFDAIAEPIRVHRRTNRAELSAEVFGLMDKVGLASRYVRKYPHEFSGGQRQRIAIARALALHPSLLIADEPVSALDVSIQAQIINLLVALQREERLAMMFISHDLGVVRHVAQRVLVMYLGRVVESAPIQALFSNPHHPYTRMLLSAIPVPDPGTERHRARPAPKGEPPSPVHPPPGCVFHPRCPEARPECSKTEPRLGQITAGHEVACPYAIH